MMVIPPDQWKVRGGLVSPTPPFTAAADDDGDDDDRMNANPMILMLWMMG
jgi:hypothetical protein